MTRESAWRTRSGAPAALTIAALTTAALTIVAVLTGCGAPAPETTAAAVVAPAAPAVPPRVSVSVPDGAPAVPPGDPIAVDVTSGALASVTLVDAAGTPVAGALSPDGRYWSPTAPLQYATSYRLTATATGEGSTTATATSAFTTATAGYFTKPYLLPTPGEVVGIGQPVAVQFDETIPDRLAAQRAITVTTVPRVEGAFYWVNDREVRWRPENYWAPGTRVSVDVAAYGRAFGGGLFGQSSDRTDFTIGRAVVATADDVTKEVTVTVDGAVVRTMAVSMGKDSTPTDNGVYIVGDKFSELVMDSSTYGVPVNSPAGYRTPVQWATRMSYSGIFFHSAPWSLYAQGSSNVSHGCLNLSPDNARWVYENLTRGDIAVVRNTVGGTLSGVDGLGDWNVPWAVWKAGNATPA